MPRAGRRQDHYEVLGLNPDAPDEVILAAHRALVAKHHPDRNPGDRDAELKLKRVNSAFHVLGNPEKRRQYDELTQSPEDGDEPPPEPAPYGEPPGYGQRQPPPPPPPAAYGPPPGYGQHQPQSQSWANQAWPQQEAHGPPPGYGQQGYERPGYAPSPDQPNRGRVEKVATHAAGGFGRVIGWVFGAALVTAVLAAWHGTCDEKHRADFSAAPTSATATLGTTTATPTATEETRWVWTTQPDYRIAFPASPRPADHSTLATGAGTAQVTAIALDRPSGAFYKMQVADFPKGSALNEQGAVDGMLKGGSGGDGVLRVLADRRRQLGDCNGRDLSATTKTFMVRVLLCMKGSRVYMAMTAVPVRTDSDTVSEATSFLDSFSVTGAAPGATAPTGSRPPPKVPGGDCGCNGDMDCWLRCRGAN